MVVPVSQAVAPREVTDIGQQTTTLEADFGRRLRTAGVTNTAHDVDVSAFQKASVVFVARQMLCID